MKVILTLFRRLILAMAVGIVIFGSLVLTPQLVNKGRILTGSMETNSTSNFNLTSDYSSSSINNNDSVVSIENRTDDYLLILRQNEKQQDEPIYPLVIDLSQNRYSTETNQKWFKSDLSITKSCSLVHEGLLYVYGGLIDKRQILKLDWCKNYDTNPKQWGNTKFIKVGQLQFDFTDGTCATNGAVVVLCFGSIGSRTCYRSDTPVSSTDWWTWFEPIVNSHQNHRLSLITSSNGKHHSY